MEYYTVEKNNILNFAGKWIDLENIILSKVTQSQKDKYHIYSLIMAFRHKAKTNQSTVHSPREPREQREP